VESIMTVFSKAGAQVKQLIENPESYQMSRDGNTTKE